MIVESKDNSLRSTRSFGIWKILAAALIALVGVLIVLRSVARSSDTTPYVRVNQVGYQTGRPGRAYLMVKGKAEGCKFTVNDPQGTEVFSRAAGASTGNWGKYSVHALDFTIEKAGTYNIAVTGAITAKSPEFKVDTAANLYSSGLSNALSFYQDQRDGADFIASDLRKEPGHLNDKSARVYQTPGFAWPKDSRVKGDLVATGGTIDASGGWWDAGDYLKFVHTTSYVVAMMLVGRRDFPNQMGPGAAATDFTKEAKFGLDWLLRMWDDNSKTLYYQVGIGSWIVGAENDHSVWRLPQEDDASHGTDPKYRYIRNRPAFVAGPAGSKISPNLAGRLAGDFALCYQIFHATDPAYANRCLLAAEHVFALADAAPSGHLLTAAPYDFYGETEWQDDLEFAATELYLALRSGTSPEGLPHRDANFYLKSAADWAAQYVHAKKTEARVLGVADISALAHFDLYRGMAGAKSDTKLAVTQDELLGDLRNTLDRAVEQALKDPFGLGFSWEGDTAAQAMALAVIAREYDFLSKSSAFSD